eukprot:gene10735-14399_t
MPNVYPFIVNDPGEGAQAKRRTQAVIIDHLMPPLTRAENHGPLQDLERQVDEYYDALLVDARRAKVLRAQILAAVRAQHLVEELGMPGAEDDAVLARVDAYLCELKETQIRDGLHVFGVSPEGHLLTDLTVALARVPRGSGEGGGQSLQRAIAHDAFGAFRVGEPAFDPLDCDMAAAWLGSRPEMLASIVDSAWRTNGDTVERIELLAAKLVSGEITCPDAWSNTRLVMDEVRTRLKPSLMACGPAEIDALMTGLAGRFVRPGPSGAPTRGRPDVLPTGRNFYSVDTRSVPTPTAWALGRKSAELL